MKLSGSFKGTPFEKVFEGAANLEAQGVETYYAMAQVAEENGNEDMAKAFRELARQEAVHSGYYATLAGLIPDDFWGYVDKMAEGEIQGQDQVMELSRKVQEAGYGDIARQIELFAKQEGGHNVILNRLKTKYKPE